MAYPTVYLLFKKTRKGSYLQLNKIKGGRIEKQNEKMDWEGVGWGGGGGGFFFVLIYKAVATEATKFASFSSGKAAN